MIHNFGWFYILAVAIFLLLLLAIAVSRYGDIRLGPDEARPAFSFASWLAMLFAAGMGIGLMYFGVGEPMLHFLTPPTAAGTPAAAVQVAMLTTFQHWGLHAWAIYAVVGLALAYFGFRYQLPLTIRSGLYPLLGERINGPLGHAVDVFALVGTVFGIATTLGYGVLQISAGLATLTGWETDTLSFQLGLIAVVMLLAGLSVASGLDKGVRRLSELNLVLAGLLLLFVLATGPTLYLLNAFSENIGHYLSSVVSLTFRTFSYSDSDMQGWFGGWTLLYWAWWISWSPFVGMFIARISRGRTIREFIIGVLLVPSLFNLLWMTVFGNSAIWLDSHVAAGALGASAGNVDALLFRFFDYLPYPQLTSGVAVLLVAVFFVTSADSGALVLNAIASRGAAQSPLWQRGFWVALLGLTAAVLLAAGGLQALQAMTLISALPFAAIMLLLCCGLLRGLRADRHHAMQALAPATSFWSGHHWRQRLAVMLNQPQAAEVQQFIDETVQPALQAVAAELATRGVAAQVIRDAASGALQLSIPQPALRDFVYGVRCAGQATPAFVLRDVALPAGQRPHSYQAMTFFVDGREGYSIEYLQQQEVIADVLKQYQRYLVLLHDAQARLLSAAPAHG
ncbi:BCCT family transporter [Vogesella fluminis]|uniref:BCCT family transporter n=1 Tax=Vogesella fluminis TaxID=1069161 RepID=UPI003645BA86